jgi:hypothetical protein
MMRPWYRRSEERSMEKPTVSTVAPSAARGAVHVVK